MLLKWFVDTIVLKWWNPWILLWVDLLLQSRAVLHRVGWGSQLALCGYIALQVPAWWGNRSVWLSPCVSSSVSEMCRGSRNISAHFQLSVFWRAAEERAAMKTTGAGGWWLGQLPALGDDGGAREPSPKRLIVECQAVMNTAGGLRTRVLGLGKKACCQNTDVWGENTKRSICYVCGSHRAKCGNSGEG